MDADHLQWKLQNTVETIGNRYFVDPTTETVAGNTIDHWKITLGAFTYLSANNMLLVGEPGTGKTTFANVIASVLSGLPFDLFSRTQLQGHPDQTKEEMLSRVHIGKLTNQGIEEVIWQNTLFLPQILIDEFNRLPEGKQSLVQEFIRTGSISYLNDVFYRGKVPFVATVNEDDRGTYSITPPNLDRFDISLEFTHGIGWLQDHVERVWTAVQSDLVFEEKTTEIVAHLRNYETSEHYEEKVEYVDTQRNELRASFDSVGIDPFIPDEEALFREVVADIELTDEATEYLDFLYDEFNLSSDLLHKRRSDNPLIHTHDQGLAYSKTVVGISARRRRDIADYARMTAFYLGDQAVTIDHVRTVAPYCLAHALEFTEDFRADHAQDRRSRGEREAIHLTRTILEGVDNNYRDIIESIKLLNEVVTGSSLTGEQREAIKELVYGAAPDHPHLQLWVEQAEPIYRERYAK